MRTSDLNWPTNIQNGIVCLMPTLLRVRRSRNLFSYRVGMQLRNFAQSHKRISSPRRLWWYQFKKMPKSNAVCQTQISHTWYIKRKMSLIPFSHFLWHTHAQTHTHHRHHTLTPHTFTPHTHTLFDYISNTHTDLTLFSLKSYVYPSKDSSLLDWWDPNFFYCWLNQLFTFTFKINFKL